MMLFFLNKEIVIDLLLVESKGWRYNEVIFDFVFIKEHFLLDQGHSSKSSSHSKDMRKEVRQLRIWKFGNNKLYSKNFVKICFWYFVLFIFKDISKDSRVSVTNVLIYRVIIFVHQLLFLFQNDIVMIVVINPLYHQMKLTI